MSKYPYGLTFTPEERARMGLASSPGMAGTRSSGTPRDHACTVPLPNGAECPVSYVRYNAQTHAFRFEEPLRQRIYVTGRMAAGVAAIEERARQLAPQAFRQAQSEEQKQSRRKTLPKGSPRPAGGEYDLSSKTTALYAGQYAVCVRFQSGYLMRLGPATDRPEEAQAMLLDGTLCKPTLYNGQSLVIGLCDRPLRKWVEPQFLASPEWLTAYPGFATTSTDKTPAAPSCETQDPEGNSEESGDGVEEDYDSDDEETGWEDEEDRPDGPDPDAP